ncbi:MAG: NAD-dependent dehydratase, partial [Candidatus Parvarchaeota archaeon]|nr:NAD-dependent dehydratase [Candidatus Parvarchaeota archaeon]
IITPKNAGSWYHWSKVYDTDNLIFANKVWGLTMTDIMQGPVYGTRTNDITSEALFTRFDFDETWGTVLNRYCVEAVLGVPLTPYGSGGQTRAFLSLEDSVTALSLLLENPPPDGGYRTVNQFTETYSVMELAKLVRDKASSLGLNVEIKSVDNPRVEAEKHYYNPERKVLPALGLKGPTKNLKDEVEIMIKDLLPYKSRLEKHKDVIAPKTNWRA